MPFDGFTTGAITYELNETLTGGKIEKIYQPLQNELFFQISNNRQKYILFISSASNNPRIYMTDEKSQNPANPSSFCMLLRKHLLGSRIDKITQFESDRVIQFDITSANELSIKESKKLLVEIMGKHSNIILVDAETDLILDSIKHVSIDISRERQILPKLPYKFPPTSGKVSFYEIKDENNLDIGNILGISKVARTEITDSTSPFKTICTMADKIKNGKFEPVVYFDVDGKPVDFYPIVLNGFQSANKREFSSVSEMLKFYYSVKESTNRIKQKAMDIQKVLKQNLDKLRLKKQRLSEDIEKAKRGDKFQLEGELLTANLYNISKGQDSVLLTDYYSNKDVVIKLDPLLSPSENAQRYFKKYNKSKTALKEKAVQLRETQENIDLLESYETYLNNAESPEEIDGIREELIEVGYLRRRKKNAAPAKKKNTIMELHVQDYRIAVGRNNKENDQLTTKKSKPDDIWFHTKDIPGSHVVLFTNGTNPPENTILEAASIAAYYSKGRESQNVPVDYIKIKHVKKPAGSKPGMVIFKNNKTVYVNPKKPEFSNSDR